jgi:hypothetical protein
MGRAVEVPERAASMSAMGGSSSNLVFDEIEMRQVMSEKVDGTPDNLWLVICTHELAPPCDGMPEERTLLACAAHKIPKSRVGRKQATHFGKCRVYDDGCAG